VGCSQNPEEAPRGTVQQGRFQTMSDSIIGRIDEMGNRIDDLERSIGDLIQQAGVEEQ
jgi:heat shock factor-binding protein 1